MLSYSLVFFEENNIMADISNVLSPNSTIIINVTISINKNDYDNLKKSDFLAIDKFFDTNFVSSKNIYSVIEHEFSHSIMYLLGYEDKSEYKSPGNTNESRLKYIGQPKEREGMYIVIYNDLINSIIRNENFSNEALQIISLMYQSIKKYYPNNFQNFILRINGLVNKIDETYSENDVWKILKSKIFLVIKGNLNI